MKTAGTFKMNTDKLMKHIILTLILACGSAGILRAQTTFSGHTDMSVIASGDKLLYLDVSDTTQGPNGTVKDGTISLLTGYFAALAVTETNKILTAPTINGGTANSLTGLSIRSTGAAFDLTFASTEVFTAGRTLSWNMGNANRLITLAGDVTFTGALTFSGAYATTITITGTTALTLPTSGTVLSTASAISLGTNTVTGTLAQFNTACTDDNFAFLGTANTFTLAQTISATTVSTSSITGSLIVSGGAGIAKDSWINTVRVGLGSGSLSSNTVLGTSALNAGTSGTSLTAIGANTLTLVTTGTDDTAVGNTALQTTTGNNNTAVGSLALKFLTTGSSNTAVGSGSLVNATTGTGNVALGLSAGQYQSDGSTALALTGDNNIFIGRDSRAAASNALTNAIVIGKGAVSDGDNTIVIGNSSTHTATRIEGAVSMPDGIRVSGVECQNVTATTATAGTTGTAIPLDNTIPQSTEGAQFLTVTITPTSATSTLIIEFDAWGAMNAAGSITVALFQDSTANALDATATTIPSAGPTLPLRLRYVMTAGTTSSTTFKIRYGPGANTAYILQANGVALFSTALQGSLTVREIRP